MAHIQFKTVKFKNFLSYGANLTTIDILDGMNWIRGANGNGKSTIIEAIHFALFGKSYRDITLSTLINNYNGRHMYVELEIDVTARGETRTYFIIRGLKPKKFEIYRDSISKETRLDEEGKSGIFQSYLENEILGFNDILFKQSIAMSAMSSTPFLDMQKADKRKFMESILGVSDISSIKKAFSSQLSDTKHEFTKVSSRIPEKQSKLEELHEILDNAKIELKDDINVLNSDIDLYTSKIKEEEKVRDSVIVIRDSKKDEGTLVSREYDEYKNVISDIASKSAKIDMINEQMTSLKEQYDLAEKNKKEYGAVDFSEIDVLKKKETQFDLDISKLDSLNMKKLEIEHNILVCNKNIDRMMDHMSNHTAGVPCDRCNRPYSESDIATIKENINTEVDAEKSKIGNASDELEKVKSQIQACNIAKQEKAEYSEKISSLLLLKNKFDIACETMKDVQSKIDSNSGILSALAQDVSVLKDRVNKAELLNAKLNKLRTEYMEAKSKVDVSNRTINGHLEVIESLKDKIKERSSRKIDDLISNTENKIKETVADINKSKNLITKLSTDIDVLQYIVTMFGDEGIKEYMIKKYIPVLNRSIDKVLMRFGVPFRISFDSTMDHTFDNSFGLAKEYKALSEGQKRRLNFSIYIAFREFVNKIGRFTTNLLFLDEILDTAMDDSGMDDMIGVLKSRVNDMGSIYLISHKVQYLNEEFDNTYSVDFDGTFSSIKKI